MSSPVVTIKEGIKMKNQNEKKIGVGSVVKAKIGALEKIAGKERSRRMRKEVVGYVQSVVGKKNLLVQFNDGHKKEIGSSLLMFLSSKEEFEMDEAISHSTKK